MESWQKKKRESNFEKKMEKKGKVKTKMKKCKKQERGMHCGLLL